MLNSKCDQPYFMLIFSVFPTFLNLVLGCALFLPIYTEIDSWGFECCSRRGLYFKQAENILVLNPQLFCLPANSQKNLPTGKMN